MNRKLWTSSFDPKKPPQFPCPTCDAGRLGLVEETTHIVEPAYSKDAHSHEEWEPDWITERFSMHLKCSDKGCGEVVVVAGDTTVLEFYEEGPEGYDVSYMTAVKPKIMFPAPPIIDVPENAPDTVTGPLDAAFGLYWTDRAAAAARIRTSLERLLDDKLVPTEAINKDGQTHLLDLNGRIQVFEKTNPDEAETFHALRMVGNIGAHGQDLKSQTLLDVLEIYEDALEKLYSDKQAKLKAIKDKILASKGKL